MVDAGGFQAKISTSKVVGLKNEIAELKVKKAAALEEEDYDAAKQLKSEIEFLTTQIALATAAEMQRQKRCTAENPDGQPVVALLAP